MWNVIATMLLAGSYRTVGFGGLVYKARTQIRPMMLDVRFSLGFPRFTALLPTSEISHCVHILMEGIFRTSGPCGCSCMNTSERCPGNFAEAIQLTTVFRQPNLRLIAKPCFENHGPTNHWPPHEDIYVHLTTDRCVSIPT